MCVLACVVCAGGWWCVLTVVSASMASGLLKDMTIVQLPTSTAHTIYQHSMISYYLYTYTFLYNVFLLSDGRRLFEDFLKSEFSQENLQFWVACEEFKKDSHGNVAAGAKHIYQEFVCDNAPRQVS